MPVTTSTSTEPPTRQGSILDGERTYVERDGKTVVDYDATARANFAGAYEHVKAMGKLPGANFVADQYGSHPPDGPPLVLGLVFDVFYAGYRGALAAKDVSDGVVSATTARIQSMLDQK